MNMSFDHWDLSTSQKLPYVAQLLVKEDNLIPSRDGYFVANTDHSKKFPLLCPNGAQVHVVENLSYAFGGVMTVTIGGESMLMKRQLGDDGLLQYCFLQDKLGNYVERVYRSSNAFGGVVYAKIYMVDVWIIGSSDQQKPIEYLCDQEGNIVRDFRIPKDHITEQPMMEIFINGEWRAAQMQLDRHNSVQVIDGSQLDTWNERSEPEIMCVRALEELVKDKAEELLVMREDSAEYQNPS